MGTIFALVGNVTHETAVVTGKVSGSSVRVALSVNADMSTPLYLGMQTPDMYGYIRRNVSGLTSGTRYYVALEVDGVIDTAWVNTFITDEAEPGKPASFKMLFFSCAPGSGSPVSTHNVHTRIAEHQADMLIHLGDFGYPNIASNTPSLFRTAWESQITGVVPAPAWRSGAFYYVYDDHDYGPDNSDGTSPSRFAASQVYREIFPHPPLAQPADAIYHSFVKGRLLFIFLDERWHRSPVGLTDAAGKTMLGATQLAWLFQQLLYAKEHNYIPVLCSSQVLHLSDGRPEIGNWGAYTHERKVIWNFLSENGITNAISLGGDVHALGFKRSVDYSDAQDAPVRCYTSSGLWQTPGGSYETELAWDGIFTNTGADRGGIYASLEVEDDGIRINFKFIGYHANRTTTEQTVQMSDEWTLLGPRPGIYRMQGSDNQAYGVFDLDGEQRYVVST